MSTLQSKPKAYLLETLYVWGETVSDAMTFAGNMSMRGWRIQGNPSPMFWNGKYGTGVSVTRIADDSK